MKQVVGVIDGLNISINIPENPSEYVEGARASGENLKSDEGYLFKYDLPRNLEFENSGVPFNLVVLYLTEVGSGSFIVSDSAFLLKDSARIASVFSPYQFALELRSDFCQDNNIGEGSILTLIEG